MKRMLRLVAVAALVLTVTACEQAAEELAERAAEQVTGTDVEVDDDGEFSVESEDGSFTANEDGEMTIETDEGTFESATGQIPDTFPSGIPLVEGGTLVNGSSLDSEDGLFWQVNWQFDSGNPFDMLDAQVAVLEGAGFTRTEDGTFTMGDGAEGMGGTMVENGEYQVNVSVLGEADDFILGYQVYEQTEE